MIKYKNLFLAAICIAAGALVIMINVHKYNKNTSANTIKLDEGYKIERVTNNKQKSNLNINNLNFSLNDNKNNLNKIVLNSEDSVFGFKSIYTLATIPHKIIKSRKAINNIIRKEKNNNIKINSEIKNIKITFVDTKTISYSNYVKNYKEEFLSKLSLNNMENSNTNNILTKTHSNINTLAKQTFAYSIIVGGAAALISLGVYSVWKCRDNIRNIYRRINEANRQRVSKLSIREINTANDESMGLDSNLSLGKIIWEAPWVKFSLLP